MSQSSSRAVILAGLLLLGGCSRQAPPAPAAAAAPVALVASSTPAAASNPYGIRSLPFAADLSSGDPAPTSPGGISWKVHIATIPSDKFAELGLEPLIASGGERNSVITNAIVQSSFVGLAQTFPNIDLSVRAGVYAGACSATEASNLIARLRATTGVDLLTFPPTNSPLPSLEMALRENLNIPIQRDATGAVVFTNVPVGLDLSASAQALGPKTLRLQAALSSESYRGRRAGNPPSPSLDLMALGSRVDLERGEALLMAGPNDSVSVQMVDRVPIAGDIPILGRLFTTTRTQTTTRRPLLIIEATPAAPAPKPER